MIEPNNITGIVLAGGKSSRMGTDKGLLNFNSKPFIQYSIDALKPLVSEIIIVSDDKNYDSFGFKRVLDAIKDAGPVSGIYSGLNVSKTKYNLILSCDIPFITPEVLMKLINNIDDDTEIVQAESNGKSMPLVAIYHKQVKERFYNYLRDGERRLRVVVKNCKYKNVILDETEKHTTINVNTQEEFNQIKDANYA